MATPTTHSTPSPGATTDPPAGGFARLERLWSAHSEAVFRAAYRVTGNPADAEDVLQTVFLRLARRGDDELDERAGGYLHRSAVNAALDVVRSRQRAGWVPLEPAAGHATLAADAPDPERQQASRELRANLRLALARLSPRAAEIFALRYFEGLPNREIADLLSVSQGVVAVLLHRTRARLRKELVALEGVIR
ncbi:MAG TPA: sigma-70 family RNA polymerase sigma factor [Thermoanaerobaculia bacterium]